MFREEKGDGRGFNPHQVARQQLWTLAVGLLVNERSQCPVRDWPTLPPSSGNRQTYCPLSDGFHVASVIRRVEIFHWVCAGGSGRWYFLKQVCLLAICDHHINPWIQSRYLQDLEQFIFKYTLVLSVLSMHIPLILPHPEGQKKLFFPPLLRCAQAFGCQHLHKWTFFPSYPLTQHSVTRVYVHTRTWSKVPLRKPLLANLCSCQSPADSCVSNMSQTAIRKSFEILKSLFFFLGSHAFSSVKFHSTIAQALARLGSFLPLRHARSMLLVCSRLHASLSPFKD